MSYTLHTIDRFEESPPPAYSSDDLTMLKWHLRRAEFVAEQYNVRATDLREQIAERERAAREAELAKYKVGAKVKVIYGHGWDGEGVIEAVYPPSPIFNYVGISVRLTTGDSAGVLGCFHSRYVELIPEPEFKVGDRVKVLNNNVWAGEAIVDEFSKTELARVKMTSGRMNRSFGWFRFKDLVLLDEPAFKVGDIVQNNATRNRYLIVANGVIGVGGRMNGQRYPGFDINAVANCYTKVVLEVAA